jgi:hypothetical protein
MAKPRLKDRPQPKEVPINTHFEETPSHNNDIIPAPPGILEESKALAIQLQESEFQSQLTFARRNPRNINRCVESMVRMAQWDKEFAESMFYAVPRGGKIIRGESIRFAEVVKQAWPNCECDAIVLAINKEEKYVVVRGYFFDYETNNRTKETVYRPIRDKYGQLYSDDMIATTCNAACSIAVRNAILAGVPRPLWMNASRAAKKKSEDSVEELPQKRQEVLKHFMGVGIAPDRVLTAVGVRSENMLTANHITNLRGMWTAYTNGDATLDELFPLAVDVDKTEAKPKARKTLADLGEEADTAPKEDRTALIEKARQDGVQGFHKGLEKPPARYASDPELSAAWQEGLEYAKIESANDDEGEEDRE